jgi:predicted DNA-binding transcriptional regulator AlpA
MVFAGKLPPPIRIVDGGSAIGWIREELVAYVESRKAARDAAPAPKKACAKAGAR